MIFQFCFYSLPSDLLVTNNLCNEKVFLFYCPSLPQIKKEEYLVREEYFMCTCSFLKL